MKAGALKALHRTYAAAWAAHMAWLVLMLVFRPGIWQIRIHLLAFGLLEGIAVVGRLKPGDTLSEFMQSIAAKVPGRAQWYQSWKALVSLFALLYALEGGYVVAYAWGWIPLGTVVATLTFLFLLYHWTSSEKYG